MENSSKKIRVLLTASGLSPVGLNTALSLRNKVDKLVGVDIAAESVAKKICDLYFQVPLASDPAYVGKILDICKRERITVILPLTIEETIVLKSNQNKFIDLGIKIANNNSLENILICNDKLATYLFLQKIKIPTANAYEVSNIEQLSDAAIKLGYPIKGFVFKPRVTHGSRGFRIVLQKYNKLDLLLNHKPTDNILSTLDELKDTIGKNNIKCLAMEKLDGDDYSVYSFAINGRSLVVIPMKRSGLIPGMSTGGEAVNNIEIIEYVRKIINGFKFNGAINVQLKLTERGPLLYEINSRISATTVIVTAFGLNFPLYEILLASGYQETVEQEIANKNIKWGVKMSRIYQEVYNENGNYFFL